MLKAHPTTPTYREAQKLIYYPQEGRGGYWVLLQSIQTWRERGCKNKKEKKKGGNKRETTCLFFCL